MRAKIDDPGLIISPMNVWKYQLFFTIDHKIYKSCIASLLQ